MSWENHQRDEGNENKRQLSNNPAYGLFCRERARSAHVAMPRNDLNIWAADIWAAKVMTASEVLDYVWA
jgi:hypothetical protein